MMMIIIIIIIMMIVIIVIMIMIMIISNAVTPDIKNRKGKPITEKREDHKLINIRWLLCQQHLSRHAT